MGSIPTSIFEYVHEKLFFIFLGKEGFHDAITRVNRPTEYACTNDAHVTSSAPYVLTKLNQFLISTIL